MEEESPELEELATLEDVMKRNDLDSDSAESVESTYINVPELKKRPVLNKVELKRKIEKEFLELEDIILRGTVELEEALDDMELNKRKESEICKLKDINSNSRQKQVGILNRQETGKVSSVSQDTNLRKPLELEETSEKSKKPFRNQDSVFKRIEDEISYRQASEKFILESQDEIVRETIDLEDALLKRKDSEALRKLEERNSVARRNSSNKDEDRQAEIQIPLMVEESVSIDLGDGSVNSKVHQVKISTNKKADLKKLLRPLSLVERSASQSSVFQQIKNTQKSSESEYNCCEKTFLVTGLLFLYIVYVAVISSVYIAMIAIGSMHLDDCLVQPYIPIYMVVGGAFGTFCNFAADSRKRFCKKSSSCNYFYGIISLFFLIWFIVGCVWVYGVSHVEYYDTSANEYCHKTVYLFAFWLLNVIFILLGASLALYCCAALCCVLDR